MQRFEIILKNEKVGAYRFLSLLMVLLNSAIFIFMLSYDINRYEALAALLLIVLYVFMRLYIAKKNARSFYFDEIIFFVLAGAWIGLQNYFMVLACLLLGVLYHLSLQKLKFVFSKDEVQKINFPKHEYQWSAFSNVMIKDEILTMDMVNNKLIQLEIEDGIKLDESDFNHFAKMQIEGQKESAQ